MTNDEDEEQLTLFPKGKDEVVCPSCGLPEEDGEIEHTAENCRSWSEWRAANRRKFWALGWGIAPPSDLR